MPIIKVAVAPDAYVKLIECAGVERRPVPWQAEILLRRALGLPDAPWAGSLPAELAG